MADLFDRADPSADSAFYVFPRKLVHIEAGAIAALRAVYERELPAGEPILDLMSSWRSHLPDGLGPVSGLGMNEEEMADNPQLTAGHVVHDLNDDPRLPYGDGAFGGVVCAVSVQYLTRPLEVFAEVRRVLRPGGPAIVSFSNRCFPTKAVRAWTLGTDADHVALVRAYLEETGFSDVRDDAPATSDDPLFVVLARV
jgi:SAM-dependent methyltransferase